MDQKFRSTPLGWVCAGLVVAICACGQANGQFLRPLQKVYAGSPPAPGWASQPREVVAVQAPAQPDGGKGEAKPVNDAPEVAALKAATVKGKYSKLLTVISVPGDQAQYVEFNDYGFWGGTAWAGYTGLPQGYWVYVHPHWYIWGQQGGQGVAVQQPAQGNPAQASVNGKYINLLKVINVPGDQGTYGNFNDYGFWNGTEWAGFQNLPQGYWVYVAPNWYIWGQVAVQPPQNGAIQPGMSPDQVKASVNGKYAKLLRVINVPQDKADYGDFSDYGHYTGTDWAGYDNLPPGYWVYVAPNWYIWGEQTAAPKGRGVLKIGGMGKIALANPNNAKANANGKYADLLKVINVPGDQAQYGAFNDWGYWTGNSWAGHNNLPPGYWVYVAPNWYIWGKNNQQPNPNPVPPPPLPIPPQPLPPQPQPNPNPQPVVNPPAADQMKAAVNGKYAKLLRVINVPADQATYGAFNDYGFYSGTEWAGYNNLPPGFWVYVAPNWYIWGEKK